MLRPHFSFFMDIKKERNVVGIRNPKKQGNLSSYVYEIERNNSFFKHRHAVMITFLIAHLFGIIGLVNIFRGKVCPATVILGIVLADLGALGTTIGAHRLWSHKSFKARTSLKILLAFLFSLAGQDSIYRWAMWHRLHHKFVDTDGDPHNSTRAKLDMSDLENDPIVMWNRKNYLKFCFAPLIVILPVIISVYFFGETVFNAFCVAACLKYTYNSHRTYLINSVAHMWGSRPYDINMTARNNKIATVLAYGEGWHNYHHAFP
ncbi:unnamed protein product, partial [Allacma fusca]